MPAPADIYAKDVDFTSLALCYPDFAKKLKSNRQLDFTDPESVRQLTKALLHRDFDIIIDLPEDRLCPPVPNRFNYILFIQNLLDTTQDNYSDTYDANKQVIGLDIGTGASAIYPLLATRQRPRWLFLATEIDVRSKQSAARNMSHNKLEGRIKLLDTDPTGETIVPSDQLRHFERIDFLMTNPPFYTSQTELESLAKQKSRPPNSACTGAPIEMICPGGETSFISRIITESALPQNRSRIQWFSSMIGKLASLTLVIEKLKAAACNNYAVTEFIQGQKTRRWCVAWSWLNLRPSLAVARGTDAVEKKLLPFPTEFEFLVDEGPDAALSVIRDEFVELQGLDWQWRSDLKAGVGRSMAGDVWSRHARRKQKRLAMEESATMNIDRKHGRNETSKFVFKISFKLPPGAKQRDTVFWATETMLVLRWLEGEDSTLFESFHGWLKRKLT